MNESGVSERANAQMQLRALESVNRSLEADMDEEIFLQLLRDVTKWNVPDGSTIRIDYIREDRRWILRFSWNEEEIQNELV